METTEQHLLEMSQHFKELINKKNVEITRLKKFVALIYGLIRTTDETTDISLIDTIRGFTSEELCRIMNIDDDE